MRKLGLDGGPNKVRDDAAVPRDIERRLEGLSVIDTFAAIRMLHEAIRDDGESPARLAALARAYAQLGVLTEYQWSPAASGLQGAGPALRRAAPRRDPNSPHATWNRAFVRALVGFHAEALADLDAAKAQARASRGVRRRPGSRCSMPTSGTIPRASMARMGRTRASPPC